jgi:hypothetical protein
MHAHNEAQPTAETSDRNPDATLGRPSSRSVARWERVNDPELLGDLSDIIFAAVSSVYVHDMPV